MADSIAWPPKPSTFVGFEKDEFVRITPIVAGEKILSTKIQLYGFENERGIPELVAERIFDGDLLPNFVAIDRSRNLVALADCRSWRAEVLIVDLKEGAIVFRRTLDQLLPDKPEFKWKTTSRIEWCHRLIIRGNELVVWFGDIENEPERRPPVFLQIRPGS